MGRTLDALFRRASKTSKLKALISLTVSRLTLLRNQRNARCSHASEDIATLLQLGQRERAIHRVEYVMKEQNMVDVFVMMESYCDLLIERSALLEHDRRGCPAELKEAISSLIFMASRSGELIELQDVRTIFTSWYGYEFAAAAIELRNGCAVNNEIVQKMSTKQPDREARIKAVNDIASAKGLPFNLDEASPQPSPPVAIPIVAEEETRHQTANNDQAEMPVQNAMPGLHESIQLADVTKLRDKFTDATAAAQAAYESATYAAAAARAAAYLSRMRSGGNGPPHGNTSKQVVNQSIEEGSGLDEHNHFDNASGNTSSVSEVEEPVTQCRDGNMNEVVESSKASEEESVAPKTPTASSVRRRRRGGQG